MIIGINAAAAIKQPRTGVEEYTYQLIRYLTMLPEAQEHRFLLYVPKKDAKKYFDFPLPENFEVRHLKWPLPMWTQIRLAIEMILHKPDCLFIPAHVLPFAHPNNSIVSVLGLEYEYYPETYSFFRRLYLRFVTKFAVRHARKIIAISESTKNDLVRSYRAEAGKIEVILLGIESLRAPQQRGEAIPRNPAIESLAVSDRDCLPMGDLPKGRPVAPLRGAPRNDKATPYLLYIGRIEMKKNVQGIIRAYEILKEKYKIPHKLVLVGAPGYGYDNLKLKIEALRLRSGYNVRELGYVVKQEKEQLLSNADIFLFPSFYEGFGLPILEAQAAGVPVVTSNLSSMPEVAGQGAILVNPRNTEEIAQAVYKIIDGKALRDKLIQSGHENFKRFSWEKCAKETLKALLG